MRTIGPRRLRKQRWEVPSRRKKDVAAGERMRWDVLHDLLKGIDAPRVAEIGVHSGRTAVSLLRWLPQIIEYACVDPWKHYPDYDASLTDRAREEDFERHHRAFMDRIKAVEGWRDRVKVLRMMSAEAAPLFEDGHFDLVFIDGCHLEAYVREDIRLWMPKVRRGGVLAGHDYRNEARGAGVTAAVDSMLPQRRVEEDYVWWVRIDDGGSDHNGAS